MKSKFLQVVVAFSLLAFSANAQNKKAEEVMEKYRFGLYIAPGSSWLKPTSANVTDGSTSYDVIKNGGKVSFGFGLSAEKSLTESVSLYSGVGLRWQGGGLQSTMKKLGATDSADYARNADVKYRMQYLSVPLGIKLKATEFDKMKIFGQLGVDANILIGRKANMDIMRADTTETISLDGVKVGIKTMNPFVLGFHVGAGMEYKITSKNSAYATILYHNIFIDPTLPQNRDGAIGTDANSKYKFLDGNVRANNISLIIGYYF